MAVTKQFCAQEMLVLTARVRNLQTFLMESYELPARECEGGGRKKDISQHSCNGTYNMAQFISSSAVR